jgi:hypothetical protein
VKGFSTEGSERCSQCPRDAYFNPSTVSVIRHDINLDRVSAANVQGGLIVWRVLLGLTALKSAKLKGPVQTMKYLRNIEKSVFKTIARRISLFQRGFIGIIIMTQLLLVKINAP